MMAMVRDKFDMLGGLMDEKLRRNWATCEALAMGRGGISSMSRATGLSRNTIRRGIRELQRDLPQLTAEIEQRTRLPGGRRRSLTESDPTLRRDLVFLLEATTRGDPNSPLRWTCMSMRALAEELKAKGIKSAE